MNGLSKAAPTLLEIDDADGAGQRVDNFLARHLKGVPRSHVYRILRSGEVRVNSRRVAADFRLTVGDRVRVPPVRTAPRPVAPSAAITPALPVLFEDDAVLVVDKPAGLAVHGGSGIAFGVIEALRAQRPAARLLELVHRLDRDTSGALMIAKKRSALTALHAALRNGEVGKRYIALASGSWSGGRRSSRQPLQEYTLASGERRVRVQAEGRYAHTEFSLLRQYAGWSLVNADLKTGRTHQIRVHLQHLGHPIAGDDKYGVYDSNRALARQGLRRMFLHAARIAFRHPVEGRRVVVTSPLPPALEQFLRGLGASLDG